MSVEVKDGYEITNASINSKLSQQKKGSKEEKYLQEVKEEKLRTHLQKKEAAENSLTPEQVKEQEKIQQQEIEEQSLRDQEARRKAFNLGLQPNSSPAKTHAINLQSNQVAKDHGNENEGISR
ncbi:MAG: hypothetical protein FJ368_02325 [Pelagibacterales bacterium]|nr:hypothetical protein [Pelagibacterales bacterium]